jgi:hypothetical protein
MSTCIPIPKLPFPSLPSGISLSPQLPSVSLSLPNPCCLLPEAITIVLSLPLPPLTINFAFLEPVQEAFDMLEALINQLPLNCPRS